MSNTTSQGELPEFHLVVRRPSRHGPLAPYRFALSIGFILLVAGQQIWYAVQDGIVTDGLLIRTAAAGAFMWIVSGIVNRILTESSSSVGDATVERSDD